MLNDHSLAGIRSGTSYRDLKFPVGGGLTFREDNPEEGIAHSEDEIVRMYASLDCQITDIIYGNWSEGRDNLQQDVVIAWKV